MRYAGLLLRSACASAILVSPSLGQQYGDWNADSGFGVTEWWTEKSDGDRFMLTCDEGDKLTGPGEMIVIDGSGPPAASTVVVQVDENNYRLTIDDAGQLDTACGGCDSEYDALWTALRRGRQMSVRFEDGRSSKFSLRGSAEALPGERCRRPSTRP